MSALIAGLANLAAQIRQEHCDAQRRAAPDGLPTGSLLDAIQMKKLTLFALKGRPTRACT